MDANQKTIANLVVRRVGQGLLGAWVVLFGVTASCRPELSLGDVDAGAAGELGMGETGGTGGSVGASAGKGGTAGTGGATGGRGSTPQGGIGSGGSGSEGSPGGAGPDPCGELGERVLVPDPNGWVDVEDDCNDVGVEGYWYAFSDQHGDRGDGRCVSVGMHPPEECSQIESPPPPPFVGFPNVDGAMHTSGTVARILPCVSGLITAGCPAYDYANMTGAGIGFDFNGERGDPSVRGLWNPAPHRVVGIQFEIDAVPLTGIRVEFPMALQDADAAADVPPLPPGSTTLQHSFGSPYWGAQTFGDGKFPLSPVQAGLNRILWPDVFSPKVSAYVYDEQRMLGIRFHVPTRSDTAGAYEFTISKLAFVKEYP